MLKKMQRRFIFYAMSAFFTVILVLLVLINGWNYTSISRQQDVMTRDIFNLEKGTQPPSSDMRMPFAFGNTSSETSYMVRFFAVHYDKDKTFKKLSMDYIASVSRSEAQDYAAHVTALRRNRGYYKGYRYLIDQTPTETIVVFLNSERELQTFYSIIRLTLIIAGLCLLVLFFLISLFSHRAVAPYVRNIETQKRFITGASHELKTPLTSISTSADVLSMDQADNEWVQNIQLQSRRMAKLISDLITLSRLDEEQPYPDRTTFSLSDAAWEISEPFSVTARSRGKEYIQRIEDDLSFTGEKDAIQQMISILLDNALKYSSENGKIRLDVKKNRNKTEISVYNTCHIENYENIDRIFERFYRLDESRTTKNSYGLGLSIAKSIAEKHGGSIHAQTQQGNNLTIRVIF